MTRPFLIALLTRKRILTIWFGSLLFFPITNLLLVIGVFGTETQLAPSPWIQRFTPQGQLLKRIDYESTSSWVSRNGEREFSFSERSLLLYQHGDELILVNSESNTPDTFQFQPKPIYIGEVASTDFVLARNPSLAQKVQAELNKAQHQNLTLSPWMFYEVSQWPGKYLFAAYVLPVHGKMVKEATHAE